MKIKSGAFIFFLFCIVKIATAQNKPSAEIKYNGFAVVELFTSQGCNSCPAADKILSEVIADARKNKKPVFALAYHVDYWNKYGWTDPFSSFAFTKRQNNYVGATEETDVYTPQVFVNGKTNFVGSDKKRLLTEIEKELKTTSKILLTVSKNTMINDTLVLNYNAGKTDKNFSLVVAIVERGLVTKVSKGENAGKTLINDNVVRAFEIFSLNQQKGAVKIPLKRLLPNTNFSLYAYVQQKQTKQILAAAGFDF
jgi:hypothetical protein